MEESYQPCHMLQMRSREQIVAIHVYTQQPITYQWTEKLSKFVRRKEIMKNRKTQIMTTKTIEKIKLVVVAHACKFSTPWWFIHV